MVGMVQGDLNVKQKPLYAIIWIHDLRPRRPRSYSTGQEYFMFSKYESSATRAECQRTCDESLHDEPDLWHIALGLTCKQDYTNPSKQKKE